MDPGQLSIIGPVIVLIILTLTIGGVTLLKPISNKLGHLLEAMAKERNEPQLSNELDHIRDLVETTNARLTLLEERQDFTDSLLQDPERRRLRLRGASGGAGPSEGASGDEMS